MSQWDDLVQQGEIAVFFFREDDLTDTAKYIGRFGDSVVDGLEKSFGDLSPIIQKDAAIPNKFNIVRKTRAAPDLGELTINERIRPAVRSALERISKTLCDHVMLIKIDPCGRPDDVTSWSSVYVVTGAAITSLTPGTLQQFDTSEVVETSATISIEDFERIFTVQLGEKADSIVLAEGVDTIWADAASCGKCASYSNGCQANYTLTVSNSGSPGLSSQVVYTTDGTTYGTRDISTLAGLSGNALNSVGKYIVVVSEADGAHHYITKANIATEAWTRVATGYVAGGSPRCIFALSSQQVYIGGADGYLYRSTDITSGVTVMEDGSLSTQNTNTIHAKGNYILSGHDSNVLKLSINEGATWSLLTGPVVGVDVASVWIVNDTQYYVLMENGTLWFTVDSGTSWTQRNLPDQGSITVGWDVAFSHDFPVVGALAIQKGATGFVYRTIDGGRSWYQASPGIIQLNTAPERFRAVALCGVDEIVTTGKKASSTDGIIAVATGGGIA